MTKVDRGTNLYDLLIAIVCIVPITAVMFLTANNWQDFSEVKNFGGGVGVTAIAYGVLKRYVF